MNQNKAIGFLLERTTRIIKLHFHQLFKSNGLDITPEQWVVLDILSKHNELTQKEIAAQSFKDAPSISRILDGLINKEMISKTTLETDRRITVVTLTEKGVQLVKNIYPKVENLRAMGIEGLPVADLDTMINTMNKIFDNYQNKD